MVKIDKNDFNYTLTSERSVASDAEVFVGEQITITGDCQITIPDPATVVTGSAISITLSGNNVNVVYSEKGQQQDIQIPTSGSFIILKTKLFGSLRWIYFNKENVASSVSKDVIQVDNVLDMDNLTIGADVGQVWYGDEIHVADKGNGSPAIFTYIKDQGFVENTGIASFEPRKFFVITLGGQSNMEGLAEGRPKQDQDNLNPRVFQLGRYDRSQRGRTVTSDSYNKVLPATPYLHSVKYLFDQPFAGVDELDVSAGPISPGLYLGKKLIPHIPDDYDILLVACACSGSRFGSGNYGSYDVDSGASESSSRWGSYAQSSLTKDMIDRTKAALALNSDNIFGGVIWIQGESDASSTYASRHKASFASLVDEFKSQLSPFSAQCANGSSDNITWYCGTGTHWWDDLHAKTVLEGYQQLEMSRSDIVTIDLRRTPDGEIIPTNADDSDYTGRLSSSDTIHFSADAYRGPVTSILANAVVSRGQFPFFNPGASLPTKKLITDIEFLGNAIAVEQVDPYTNTVSQLTFKDSAEADITDSLIFNLSLKHGFKPEVDQLGLTYVAGDIDARRDVDYGAYMRPTAADAYVISAPSTSLENYSLTGLIRITSDSNFQNFLTGTEGIGPIFWVRSGRIMFIPNFSVTTTEELVEGVLPLGEWCHVGCTYNNTTKQMKVYINGKVVDINTSTFDSCALQTTLQNSWNGGNYFHEDIAEIRIYGKELSPEEMRVISHNAKTVRADQGDQHVLYFSPSGNMLQTNDLIESLDGTSFQWMGKDVVPVKAAFKLGRLPDSGVSALDIVVSDENDIPIGDGGYVFSDPLWHSVVPDTFGPWQEKLIVNNNNSAVIKEGYTIRFPSISPDITAYNATICLILEEV